MFQNDYTQLFLSVSQLFQDCFATSWKLFYNCYIAVAKLFCYCFETVSQVFCNCFKTQFSQLFCKGYKSVFTTVQELSHDGFNTIIIVLHLFCNRSTVVLIKFHNCFTVVS